MNIENLYRQVIMEHYKYPKHKGLVQDLAYTTIRFNNPSCGDEIVIQMLIKDQKIQDIKHDGKGCSICCSSASVMSDALIGKDKEEAKKIIHEYYEMIKGMPFNEEILKGDAIAYQGVAKFPARIKCATLAWKAVEKGIEDIKEE